MLSYCGFSKMSDCVYCTSSAGTVTTAQSGPVCSLSIGTHPSSKVETLSKCPV